MIPRRKREPTQDELLDKQHNQSLHAQNLGATKEHPASERLDTYVELMGSDLDAEVLDLVKQFVARDFALGNITDAEAWELRLLREIRLMMIKAATPDDDTAMKGKVRRLVYTDNGNLDTQARELHPIDGHEYVQIRNIIDAAHFAVTRSIDAEQWEQLSKSYQVSEVRDGEDKDGSGGWLSFR